MKTLNLNNPFKLNEEEFNQAKEIAINLIGQLHSKAGHSIDLAITSASFTLEALLGEKQGHKLEIKAPEDNEEWRTT